MAKSLINILQEHCIVVYKCYPQYVCTDLSSPKSIQFKYDCVVNNIKSSGIASSKSAAKNAAAQEMIVKLGIGEQCHNPREPSQAEDINYVGRLNEHCSKNKQCNPIYIDAKEGTLFKTTCEHLTLKTIGMGSSKKVAKQESARRMLDIIKDKSKGSTSTASINNNNIIDDLIEHINFMSLNETKLNALSHHNAIEYDNSPKAKQYVPPIQAENYVGLLNEYCAKYKYKKPDYLECGMHGSSHKMKCLYQSFATEGFGATVAFAKQESAKKMMEVIGIAPRKAEDAPLISLSARFDKVLLPSKSEKLIDNEIVDVFKAKSTPSKCNDNTNQPSNDLILFDDHISGDKRKNDTGPKCPSLERQLKQNGVEYKIRELQKNPYILAFNGKQTTSGVEKHLLEFGSSYEEAMIKILCEAVKSFTDS